MANPEDIIANIIVEGGDDADATFKKVAESGKSALAELASAFGPVAEAGAAFSAAIIGVGVALETWSRHASEAITELSHLASQVGVTITEMSALEGTFASMGVNTDSLGVAFKRLAVQIELQWGQIQKSIRGASDLAINDMLAMQSAALNVEKAGASLVTAQQKLREITTGEKVSPETQKQQQVQAAVLAVEEAELHLQEAIQKRNEAAKKANEDYKNSMEAVGNAVQAVASGQANFADASKNANLEIQNVIKGLVLSAGASQGASESLQGFTGGLGDITNQAPAAKEVFYQLADFMKNSGDAALNTAVSFRLFGRGVRADMIEALSQGSQAIKDHEQHLIDLGLVYTKTDEEIALGLHKATAALSYDLSTTSNQIGNLFSPAWTEVANNFTKAIENAHKSIIDFASALASDVNPLITDFFKLITGDDNFTSRWGQLFGLLQDIGRYIGDILGPIIGAIGKGIAGWLDVFNLVAASIRLMIVDMESFAKQVAAVGKLLLDWDFSKFKEATDKIVADAEAKRDKIYKNLAGEKPPAEEKPAGAPSSAPAPGAQAGAATPGLAGSFQEITVKNEDGSTSKMYVNRDAATKPTQTTTTGQGAPAGTQGFAGTTISQGGAKIVLAPKQPGLVDADKEPLLPPEAAPAPIGQRLGGRIVTDEEIARFQRPSAPEQPSALKQTNDSFFNPLKEMADSIKAFFTAANPQTQQQNLTGKLIAPTDAQGNIINPTAGTEGPGRATQAITDALAARDQAPSGGIGTAVGDLVNAIKTSAIDLKGLFDKDILGKGLEDLGTASTTTTSDMQTVGGACQNLSTAVGDCVARINEVSAALKVPSSSGFAEGGHVRGAGTGTSDSINARLSNNEYVQPERSVMHYGLQFMESVRNLSFPKGFSMGGLFTDLSIPIQSYASGGHAVTPKADNSMAGHFSVDLRTDKGTIRVIAPPSTVDHLHGLSVARQIERTGPDPGWSS